MVTYDRAQILGIYIYMSIGMQINIELSTYKTSPIPETLLSLSQS